MIRRMAFGQARRHARSTLGQVTALAGVLLASLAAPAAADYRLTILHIGALQSRLEPVTESGAGCGPEALQAERCRGGLARLVGRIRTERARSGNVVVVNAGNALAGPFYDHYKQRAVSDALNLVGLDAMTVGERDFADGTEMLAEFQKAARFPLLGANIDLQRDPAMRDRLYPFLATVVGGEEIALIGYSSEQLIERARPAGVVHVEAIEVALRRWMEQIEMMGITKVVAVSTAGAARDREIAAAIPGIDVIIAMPGEGETAGAMDALEIVKGPAGDPVLLMQAVAFGGALGRLDVTFDGRGVARSWQAARIALTDPGDEDVQVKRWVGALAAGLGPRTVSQRGR